MRTLILIAGTALALAACRNHNQVDNTTNVDESLSADNVVSNDVTAIDAVTGEDANMAADVSYNDTGLNNGTSDLNETAPAAGPVPHKAAPKPAPAKPAPAKPAADTATTTNTQ